MLMTDMFFKTQKASKLFTYLFELLEKDKNAEDALWRILQALGRLRIIRTEKLKTEKSMNGQKASKRELI